MAQQFGSDMRHCVECGNVVSMLYVEHEGDVWCPTCYDTMMEEKEEEEDE